MVYVHLAEGFEEVEAVTATDVLRRAQVPTAMVSVTGKHLVKGAHGVALAADILFEDADFDAATMIVLPGGMPGALNLAAHQGLCERIQKFAAGGKLIAAICAAPNVLGGLGLLDGRKATCYPGCESGMGAADTIQDEDAPVVIDANIITSRGPGTAMSFALALVEALKGKDASRRIAEGLLHYVQ